MEISGINAIIKQGRDYKGLSSAQAADGLIMYGPNSRPWKTKRHWWRRLYDILSEPMMLLISATAVVYYFIGERVEAIIFCLSIVPIGLMNYFQQRRTDRALYELSKMIEEFCMVYRDGKLATSAVVNLVPADLVHLVAGDKIPADGYLLSGDGLMIDESMLTGESSPVVKKPAAGNPEADNKSKLFQGTLVTSGEGEFFVVHTGLSTEYGRIGSLLEKITKQQTPLQNKIRRLIRGVAVFAIFAAVMVGILLSFGRGVKDGILGGLTMAMSLIPEEFPIVFSVFLIIGVWRLAQKNALVRQMTTVETLGSATVICTDKTGTLTEGRMSFDRAYYQGEFFDTRAKQSQNTMKELAEIAILSFEHVASDPLETEVQRYAKSIGLDVEKIFSANELITDTSFDAETKMVHHLWQSKTGGGYCQYSAGAPESIIRISAMPDSAKEKINAVNSDLAGQGYRVIGLGKKNFSVAGKIDPAGIEFIGLLAMSDPPREKVASAIKMCQEAGIRVIMITGDNKLTAHSVAERIGLKHGDNILNSEDIAKMSPAALKNAVANCNIFARVRPEDKYQIVEALRANGEVVAMTGDGVNDSLALKKADIGIAMGQKGTEVAREAADMVLLDDNFFTIIRAVKEGRKIYGNLQQSFVFLLSFHIPIVGLAILPLFFGEPLIFLPVHVIFLELICDPASVIGFEKEKAPRNVMSVPPRPADEPLIPVALWGKVAIQAFAIFAISFGFYVYFARVIGDFALGRTLAFVALVISQTMLIFLTREWYQIRNNLTLTGIGFAVWLALSLIVFVPALSAFFHLAPVSPALYGFVYLVSFAATGFAAFTYKYMARA
jgi:Ca2+-transporting ATPase